MGAAAGVNEGPGRVERLGRIRGSPKKQSVHFSFSHWVRVGSVPRMAAFTSFVVIATALNFFIKFLIVIELQDMLLRRTKTRSVSANCARNFLLVHPLVNGFSSVSRKNGVNQFFEKPEGS
jgi:hypothetical protein